MGLVIAGLGTAVPGKPVAQTRAAGVASRLFDATPARERMVAKLYRWTRVGSRHSVLPDRDHSGESGRETDSHQGFFSAWRGEGDRGPTTRERMERYEDLAPRLALEASRSALEDAAVEPGAITHLVTVSCSGFSAPGVDVALIKQLGLDPGVARSHVGFMGCHGALNGLRIARAFVEADPSARVLLSAVELCTLHAHYGWDPEQIVANAIFSDGAAALVATGDDPTAPKAWRVAANGCTIMADSEDAMTWRIRDHGFEMTLSARVPDIIREQVRPWLESWLREQGLSLPQVGSWAIHPGGPRILDAVARATGLDKNALAPSYEVLERYGNMSSPTVLFLLERLRTQHAQRPIVALGFGPGLAIEAALIR